MKGDGQELRAQSHYLIDTHIVLLKWSVVLYMCRKFYYAVAITGFHTPFSSVGTGAVFPSVKRPGRIAHLHLMLRLRMRMSGAVPPSFTCVYGVQLPIYFILMPK